MSSTLDERIAKSKEHTAKLERGREPINSRAVRASYLFSALSISTHRFCRLWKSGGAFSGRKTSR